MKRRAAPPPPSRSELQALALDAMKAMAREYAGELPRKIADLEQAVRRAGTDRATGAASATSRS